MSLAINAAPFNNDHDENLNLLGESVIHQKKNQFRKTQKNKEMEFNSFMYKVIKVTNMFNYVASIRQVA